MSYLNGSYQLDVDRAKQAYNWFYHAFDSETNPRCTQDDINLKNDLEKWLIDQGE